MGVEPGGARRDPPGGPVGGGAAAVERGGELPGHERPSVLDGERPLAVHRPRLVGQQARLHVHAGPLEGLRPADGHRVAVGLRVDHAHHPGPDQRLGARAGATAVVAGLERHHGGGAPCGVTGPAQRVGLRVRRTGSAVEALGDHRAVGRQQHAAHARVRADGHAGGPRQVEGARHRGLLGPAERHRDAPLVALRADRGDGGKTGTGVGTTTPAACTSHPDFDRRSRSSTWSTGCWLQPGRGLSPPARNFTDPRARELFTRRPKPATTRPPSPCEVSHPARAGPAEGTRPRPRALGGGSKLGWSAGTPGR